MSAPTRRASRSPMPRWKPSTSPATRSTQNGTTRSGRTNRSGYCSNCPKTDCLRLHHGFLEVLRRPESNLLAGLDFDGFARRRVATHPCRALADLQDAEARDADARALLQMLADIGHHLGQHDVRLRLRKAMRLGQRSSQILQRNRFYFCHCCHLIVSIALDTL